MTVSGSMKDAYTKFIDEGTLILMPGSTLDMLEVYDVLQQHITDCDYDVYVEED